MITKQAGVKLAGPPYCSVGHAGFNNVYKVDQVQYRIDEIW